MASSAQGSAPDEEMKTEGGLRDCREAHRGKQGPVDAEDGATQGTVLGRIWVCDVVLRNGDRLVENDLGWRGNLTNLLLEPQREGYQVCPWATVVQGAKWQGALMDKYTTVKRQPKLILYRPKR